MTEHDITSKKQLQHFVEYVFKELQPHYNQAFLLTLSGDLGAGKTTFTQELGSLFGIKKGEINSPTYVIEQRYPTVEHSAFKELVHIDAYRLEQDGDPQKIGLNHTLNNPTTLVVIEWPEKISTFLNTYKKVEIILSFDGNSRKAILKTQ